MARKSIRPAPPGQSAEDAPSASIHALPHRFASDEDLVAACIAKRAPAARAIWDRFSGLVRGILRRSLGRQDVEDSVQDSFMRFFRLVDRLREPSKLRSFVVGVTLRVAREELRRRRVRRWLTLTSDGHVPETLIATSDTEATEALRRFERLLNRLDTDSRVIFVLRFVEEIPTVEIADALSCSLATAKRRVKRAREKVEAAAAEDPVLWAYVSTGGDDA